MSVLGKNLLLVYLYFLGLLHRKTCGPNELPSCRSNASEHPRSRPFQIHRKKSIYPPLDAGSTIHCSIFREAWESSCPPDRQTWPCHKLPSPGGSATLHNVSHQQYAPLPPSSHWVAFDRKWHRQNPWHQRDLW